MEMNTKNILVSFLAIVSIFALMSIVAADVSVIGTEELVNDMAIKVDGMYANDYNISVVAGDKISVKAYFTAMEDASDVRMKAEIEGDKVDVDARTMIGDLEEDHRYSEVLTLEVPHELKDEVSEDMILTLKFWDGDFESEYEILVHVQRPSYSVDIKSLSVAQSVEAGETMPVDIVLKNNGYNDLEDLYVTATIASLGVEKKSYFGDLVVNETDDDDEDTLSGRLYLEVPYGAQDGIYELEVKMHNEDMSTTMTKQIVVSNNFANGVIVTSASRTVSADETAEYSLLIVNPTDKLKVYRIVTESSESLSSSTTDAVVAIPAGSSKTVRVMANADTEGEYNFNVNVLSEDGLVDAIHLNMKVKGTSMTNPIVVLTVILAIIFLVLLVVLVVLLGKKPEKAEEFGESYY